MVSVMPLPILIFRSVPEVKFKKCAGSFEHCKIVLIPISQIFVGLFLPCYVSASS